jgi:WD40 repeat protein
MREQQTHPDAAQLAAFDSGALPPDARALIEQHIAGCAQCCEQLDALPDDPLVALLRVAGPQPATDTHPLGPRNLDTPSSPALSASADVPTELVGHPRYRILGLLGSGGMGTVFKAEHKLMERIVALKVIRSELIAKPEAVERFRGEAKAAAHLSHPNIVIAHDAEQAGDVHFLVMEYVEGESLESLVRRRGPMPVEEACDYVRQAALGLQHAFERGMVHRDIKPANLLISDCGLRIADSKTSRPALDQSASRKPQVANAKIADFGLARFASEQASGTATPMGVVVGTPDYIAPEQAMDPRRADIRADIYSLGCTLYHLLAGRPPFPEGTALQKLLAHQQKPPTPLGELRPDVPPELGRVLERMMAKEPARRYQTPADVAEALVPFTPIKSEPPPRRSARWAVVATVLAMAFVTVVGVVAWTLLREKPRSDNPAARHIGGTTGPFSAVAFNSACTRALAAGPDHALQLWDLENGMLLARLEGHADTVESIMISADGVSAVSGGRDRTVIVWDLQQHRLHGKFAWHKSPIRSTVYTHDPRHVLSASEDGDVALWEIDKPEPKRTFHDEEGATCLALDRYGDRLLVAGTTPTFRRWDYANRAWQRSKRWPGHEGGTASLSWSYDARFFLSGGIDGAVRLWRGATGRQLAAFNGQAAPVRCVAMTRNEMLASSGDETGTVRLWDVFTGQELARYSDHQGTVLAVRFSYTGDRLASAGAEGSFILRDVPVRRDGRPVGFLESFSAVAISADGRLLAAARDSDTVTLHELVNEQGKTTPREAVSVSADSHIIFGVALTPVGKLLATGGWDHVVRLWDVAVHEGRRTCTLHCALEGHTAAVRGVALSADGKTLASYSADGAVRLWDVPAVGAPAPFSVRAILEGHSGTVRALALSADGGTLVTGGADGTVRIWDARAAKARHVLNGHRGEVVVVALSPDGLTAASGGTDYTARLWSVEEGRERAVLPGHLTPVEALAFSGDGAILASASEEKTLKLWHVATAKNRVSIGPTAGRITSLAFRADGRLLIGVTNEGELQIWDMP